MAQYKIIVADSNDVTRTTLKSILIQNGYFVYETQDGSSTVRLARSLKPDLVILDNNIIGISGFEIIKIFEEGRISPILFISNTIGKEFMEELREKCNFTYVTRSLDRNSLVQIIDYIIYNSKKIAKMLDEIDQLKRTIESRKKIEKAKGLLMKVKGMSEDDAYKYMRKRSMDKGIPMEQIADAIIIMYS
ncbi:response regulator receiver and ANTAR domain protein [Caldanaerobius fijiensis DSM 17918]|uniref:Stage 0 sporulation protein A homolog n=1 Tax=Caldanaerobius fijiensis DSM 17918 TaxID=1121256 RepID=A0A1M4VNM5_9THEO|nr:ANTAR domain-containing protein [Caldanaerobius fijiensis]SHE70485.1 response regulator receiver and ANTAR domain protein [Caldanaerobius fijiensis DSM 17918]